MPLELHIWGPAFGLPSIDAECLAAIAYLRHCLRGEEWVLVASSDPSVSATSDLPALKSGSLWISRYRNIVNYLKKYSTGESDLDRDLDSLQRADSIAFSTFIESRGLPLLDLSLYVSSENYTTCTRSAFGNILPWPSQWITPPKLRAVAKKRSQHLNLSSLDINTAHEELTEASKLTAQIPKSLRTTKKTVTNVLGKGTARNQFRLDAVTSDFFEPLAELLGDNEWFNGDSASSLDCLALGYLALMQTPQLPHSWLKQALTEKFPRLDRWTEKFALDTFGGPITPAQALLPPAATTTKDQYTLPWQAPARPSVGTAAYTVLETAMDALPLLGRLRANRQLKNTTQHPEVDEYQRKQLAVAAINRNREMYSRLFAAGTGIGAFVGYMFWVGLLKFGRQQANGGKRDFGAAGSMLGLG